MATRERIHIFENYAAPHILNALFIYVLRIKKKMRGRTKSYFVFYILFKTQRPSDTVF